MAVRTSNATGNWGTGATWVGGVAPVEGDSFIIASPHVVTVDGTYIVGDDTQTAGVVNNGGTLKASRAVNSSLTFKGTCTINGILDYGTSADPITSAVTATLIGNYSAALVANKYIIHVNRSTTNQCWMFGAAKTVNTTSTASCAGSQAVISVADVTGWVAGDLVAVTGTGSAFANELKTILSIAGNNVTMTTNFTITHASGCYVSNMSSNVIVKPYNTTYPFAFVIAQDGTTATNSRELQYVMFRDNGTSTSTTVSGVTDSFGSLTLSYGAQNAYSTFINLKNLAFVNTASGIGGVDFRGVYSYKDIITDSAFYGFNSANMWLRSGSTGGFLRCMSYSGNVHVVSNFSQAGVGFTFDTCHFVGGNIAFSLTSGTGYTSTNCTFDYMTNAVSPGYGGDVNFNTCIFGNGVGTPLITTLVSMGGGFLEKTYFNNCTLGSITNDITQTSLNISDPTDIIAIVNRNSDPTNQQIYTRLGNYSRDNSTFNHSKSSLVMTTANSQNCTYSQTVASQNGVALTVAGSLQINAAYLSGAYTLPKVTISGLGITPQTFTASASAGTWQEWTFTVTQTSGYDGNLTVTYTGQSATTTGTVNFDGFISTVFVTFARFYGYIFNTSTPVLTVDPVIQAAKATAAAYTGIGISGTTITLSTSHTIREIYDYIHYYLQLPANLGTAEFLTSTDGVNFSSTYNLVVNTGVALSGTFALTLTGGATLTMTGTATSTGNITHTSGTKVWTRITLTNMTAGSTVQLYDNTSSTQLYDAVVAGTSLEYQQNWTADHTIRYRVAYMSGVTAKEFIDSTGTFTSSGMAIQIAQVNDPVYIANAIDGSGVTGITISSGTSTENINLAGGTVSWPTIYAYQVYWQTTTTGIAAETAFISATDSSNYLLTGFKIRNTNATPLTITGGWGRDSTTLHVKDCIDSAGSTGNIYVEPDHVVAYNAATASTLTLAQFIALK